MHKEDPEEAAILAKIMVIILEELDFIIIMVRVKEMDFMMVTVLGEVELEIITFKEGV